MQKSVKPPASPGLHRGRGCYRAHDPLPQMPLLLQAVSSHSASPCSTAAMPHTGHGGITARSTHVSNTRPRPLARHSSRLHRRATWQASTAAGRRQPPRGTACHVSPHAETIVRPFQRRSPTTRPHRGAKRPPHYTATAAAVHPNRQQAAPCATTTRDPSSPAWSLEADLQSTWHLRPEDALLICSHPLVASVDQAYAEANLSLLFSSLRKSSATTLLRRHPGLLLAPLTAWQAFFGACGMPDPQFRQLLTSCPTLFVQGSIYNTGRAMLVLRTLGISEADLCSRIPLRYPQLLLADVDTCLQPAATFLHTLNLPPATLAQFTSRAPRLLTRPPATTMAPTLHHLRTLPIPPPALSTLLVTHPHILGMAPADIDACLDFFHSIGLTHQAAISVLLSCPEALTFTRGNLERKWRFLREEMGGGVAAVRRYPRYFAAGLQMETGPRFLFVRRYPLLLVRLWGGGHAGDGAAAEGGGAGGAATIAASSGGTVDGAGSKPDGTQTAGAAAAAGDALVPEGHSRGVSGGQEAGELALEWLLATPIAELVEMAGESVAAYEDHMAACQHDLAVNWSAGRAVS